MASLITESQLSSQLIIWFKSQGYQWRPTMWQNTACVCREHVECKQEPHHWQTDRIHPMLHNARYRQWKNKQKSSPSVLSDAEVPRPVSPLSDVPGLRPKRLWNFSDTAGVCHSMSAKRANVYLRNKTTATESRSSTNWTATQLVHFDSWVSTYPQVWIQYISVKFSFHRSWYHLGGIRQ